MSDSGSLARIKRLLGVALLLASLLVPALLSGLGETASPRGAEEAVLVAPDATQEMPSDRETAGAPLLLLFPAGLVGSANELPEPSEARHALAEADRLRGAAVLPFPPPPPRRA